MSQPSHTEHASNFFPSDFYWICCICQLTQVWLSRASDRAYWLAKGDIKQNKKWFRFNTPKIMPYQKGLRRRWGWFLGYVILAWFKGITGHSFTRELSGGCAARQSLQACESFMHATQSHSALRVSARTNEKLGNPTSKYFLQISQCLHLWK